CPPLLVNFTTSILSSHTFTNWSWDFGDMSSSVVQNPSHLYVIPGGYDVTVVATTPAGCQATVSIPGLIQIGGPYGSFTFAPSQVCPGDPVTFTATGTPNVEEYLWDLGGGILDTGQIVTINYTVPGIYNPVLIVEDSSDCQVLIQSPNSVTVHPLPVADFSVTAPDLCDMGTVNFSDQTSSANPIQSWQWDFGDGSPPGSGANPAHTYNSPGTYDVQLIVTTVNGCTDTIVKAGIITVHTSPIAVIGVSDSAGCEPFTVQFSDLSPATNFPIQNWDWNFGLFGANSTLQNPSYTYLNDGTYQAFLLITDSNGCTGSDSRDITIWPLPEPNFVADDSFGCAPKDVQFIDLTPTAVTWEWNFGDNSPVSPDQNPLHTYQTDGVYSVTLQVWDANGCTNSLTKNNYINLDHPEAAFTVSDRVVCPGANLTFFDNSQSDTAIVAWAWDFGDGTGTSNAQNPTYAYQNSGFYDVTLTVTDIFGCTSTITQTAYIEVLVNEIPEIPNIRYVTVLSDNSVEIAYDAYTNLINDFGRYIIYRENQGNWVQVYSTTNINELSWTDSGLDTKQNSYCYRIQVENYCGLTSDLNLSETHCTILLTTTSQVDQILLDWSDYVGWGGVESYQIYRVNNYSTSGITLIATVPGNQTAFTDTNMFCYDAYTYRIRAKEQTGEEISWSNIKEEAPMHFGPPNPMHMSLATVQQNSYIWIRWENIPLGDNLNWVEIEKNTGNGFQQILRHRVTDTIRSYEDFDVDVSSQPYQYRAFVIDTCGDYTPIGRYSASMHLRAERDNGIVYLNWTPYKEWEYGVERYDIEVFNESTGLFELVGTVIGSLNSFVDDKTDLAQASYCYRIIAHEIAGNLYTSTSNEACVLIDPLLFFPNAFTPNQDLFNDRFLIPGVFLDEFRMEIYNRWGKKIFETTAIDEGWDGTSNGVPVPEGVYVFKAFGRGYAGQIIQRAGTVTLIR
ncbi:MAG: PKD domain-containing protein, partial [Bacteroidetes bacterium]|nr:PKD domain-containing protein [Bacteroidota bacterium]